jgi:hypothetical protein
MACDSKINTLKYLRDKGIIDDKRVITKGNSDEFDRLNNVYTKYANDTYNVNTGEKLFTIERKENLTGETIYRVHPNEKMFEMIDKVIFEEQQRIIEEDNAESIDYMEDYEAIPSSLIPNYEKYVLYKKNLKYRIESRLNKIKADKQKYASDSTRLKILVKMENDLKNRLEGSEELKLTGLREEISELENANTLDKLTFYAERDLTRLEKLAESTNEEDLAEARVIIRFYNALGTFDVKESHPVFELEDIFNSDGVNVLDPQVIKSLEALKERAKSFENKIYQKEKIAVTDAVNNNRKIKALYGEKEFTHEELFFKEEGLRDAAWVDMFVMDITNGIMSHNGIIPQVMMNTIQNAFEDNLVYAKSVEERVALIQKQVEDELKKMGYGINIPGLKGVSYDIFRAVDKDNQFQDGVTQRYTAEFAEAKSRMLYDFNKKIKEAQLIDNPDQRAQAIVEAYSIRDNWHRKHTIIIDPRKLPEVINDPSMAKYKQFFDTENSEAYVANLKELLGEQGYKEEIDKQLKLLKEYTTMLEVYTDSIIAEAGVANYSDLDKNHLDKILLWEKRNSPFEMVENFRKGTSIMKGNLKLHSTMQYNYAVPRKFKTHIALTPEGAKITDTQEPTGYYDERFKIIEANPVLKEFHNLLMEVNQKIFDTMPPEMRKKFSANSIPALQKSLIEILFDPNANLLQRIAKAAREIYDRIRALFGMNAQNNLSYASVDPITGMPEYKINSQFLQGNKENINERYQQELLRFKYANGMLATTPISKFDTFDLNKLTPEAIQVLAEALNVEPTISAIMKRLPSANAKEFELGKYLKNGITHQIVAENSLDLPKIMKLYSYLTMEYAARQEVLPFIEMTKRHYEEIKQPVGTNTGGVVTNALNKDTRLNGVRTNANKQMNSWFERVVLGNYASRDILTDPRVKRAMEVGATGIDKVDRLTKKFRPTLTGKILDSEEKVLKKKLEVLLGNINKELASSSDEDKTHILTIKSNVEAQLSKLGKDFSRVATMDAIFNFIRLKGLGWNVSSGVTNFMEGQIANFTIAASGDYFKPENIYAANTIIKESFLKNATFGKVATPKARKAAALMEKYRILQDASNELQKASSKSAFSKVEAFAPYTLTKRIEYLNQTPLMIAKLMDIMITGKDGTQKSVWDAMQSDGNLSENFATEENKKNWEDANGADYQDFASTMKKMIVNAHGDYDALRGNMATESSLGKALLMFKRWMARQFYQRFASEKGQTDIEVGIKNYKGRYRSHTKSSGFLHGAIIGGTVLGPLGALGGGLAGAGIANFYGSRTELGFIQELAFNVKELGLTLLRMPVNSIMGKDLIKHNDYEKLKNGDVTDRDIRNMKANMVDLAVMLGFLAMLLFVKALLWDDEDEEGDTRRRMHNLLANRAMQLSGQSSMYINPVEAWKSTAGDFAGIKFAADVIKFAEETVGLITGNDTYTSGPYAGQSKWMKQFEKTFVPSVLKPGLGFSSQMDKQFEKSYYDKYFKGDEVLAEEEVKVFRSIYRDELKEQGVPEEELTKRVNDKYPPKKEDQTYLELLEQYSLVE